MGKVISPDSSSLTSKIIFQRCLESKEIKSFGIDVFPLPCKESKPTLGPENFLEKEKLLYFSTNRNKQT